MSKKTHPNALKWACGASLSERPHNIRFKLNL